MASFTYDLSAFQGHLISAEDTQPDCELARMFPSLHYYDGGILGDDYWEIEDVGRFGTLLDQWWACDGDHDEFTDPDGVHHIVGNFYIENSAGYSDELTPAVFEKTGVYEANPNYKTLTQIYGDVLYRQTVSYIAGLFNVFAASAVELPAPQPDVKVNGSDETVGVSKGDSFDIAISLDSGYAAGQEADWLFAILYYDQNLGEWTVYHYAQYRAALFDMGPEFATLDTSGVPDEGLALLFFFAIGLDLDGSYDFSDTALVYIQPNTL